AGCRGRAAAGDRTSPVWPRRAAAGRLPGRLSPELAGSCALYRAHGGCVTPGLPVFADAALSFAAGAAYRALLFRQMRCGNLQAKLVPSRNRARIGTLRAGAQ